MAREMVEIPLPPKWKQLWNTWDLRGFIILSLSLQTILIFLAPLRKRVTRNLLTAILWSSYLLADWAADFAVGLISNSQGNPNGNKKTRTPVENEDILAFWAPFLLVHLGGPDTITAFAMEDNELWLRHLLGLMFQFVAAIYVFIQSLPHNRLWIPTVLMFITGVIKYGERTRSLYLASADTFKDSLLTGADPGPNYATLMDEYTQKKKAKLPTRIEMVHAPDTATRSANKAKKGKLTELEVVQYGYQFYKKFRGVLVDMIFSRKERNWSRDFFLRRNAKDAFSVVEVELNFVYEALFTKLPVVSNRWGRIARLISLATLFSAIILFIMESKSNFSKTDITITYALLFGALVLDTSALCMLLFSNWTIIYFEESPDVELEKDKLKTKFLKFMTEGTTCKLPMMGFLRRRWSENVSTYNLIHYCLNPLRIPMYCSCLNPKLQEHIEKAVEISVKKIVDRLGVSMLVDHFYYVKHEKLTDELKDFIFDELRSKSELADDLETAKEIISARGDWVLRVEEGGDKFLKYVVNVDYDQSLILWHIATELCYNIDDLSASDDKEKKHWAFAKLLSDYMLYLLIMQPGLMSAVAGIGHIRFRDTCAEIERFYSDRKGKANGNTSEGEPGHETKEEPKQKRACEEILMVPTEVQPATIKGDRSKSLLFDSCILAKDLKNLDKRKWEIVSKVWVELLCYAASHARANAKVAEVSKGGELITTVWLMMTHFGLGDQFQIDEGQTRAKLIVGK